MGDVRSVLRWGTWGFGGIVLLLPYRPYALDETTQAHPSLQRAAFLASVVLWLLTGAALPAGRLRGFPARALLVAVTTVTAVSTLAVPAGQQLGMTSWAVSTNVWLVITIGWGGRTAPLVAWLVLPLVLAIAVGASGGAGQAVPATARMLGILGLCLPVAAACAILERTARLAAGLGRERERIRTAQVVAAAVVTDRLGRSHHVRTVVEPVLADLAALRPDERPDPRLRRRCGVAGARVRQLLGEWYRGGADPLGTELTACLEGLRTAGLRVDLVVHGPSSSSLSSTPPSASSSASGDSVLPPALVSAGCDTVLAVAPLVRSRMRVTVLVLEGQVRLSILIDTSGPPPAVEPPPPPAGSGVTVRTTTSDDSLWLELTCPLPPPVPSRELAA